MKELLNAKSIVELEDMIDHITLNSRKQQNKLIKEIRAYIDFKIYVRQRNTILMETRFGPQERTNRKLKSIKG